MLRSGIKLRETNNSVSDICLSRWQPVAHRARQYADQCTRVVIERRAEIAVDKFACFEALVLYFLYRHSVALATHRRAVAPVNFFLSVVSLSTVSDIFAPLCTNLSQSNAAQTDKLAVT